ncbi:hypothetical protein Micbo1qcDRAFT_23674 [Microdochium bolleyi]|uniref:Uncharacterized protein n=1 Tax=Microdochium bolleyi TaxID=196109 RepID=A0A136JCY8_9PEZI|nr:hypothetical protein Micbo1qcDRAFT_23674 [Microdochium bolleyi]
MLSCNLLQELLILVPERVDVPSRFTSRAKRVCPANESSLRRGICSSKHSIRPFTWSVLGYFMHAVSDVVLHARATRSWTRVHWEKHSGRAMFYFRGAIRLWDISGYWFFGLDRVVRSQKSPSRRTSWWAGAPALTYVLMDGDKDSMEDATWKPKKRGLFGAHRDDCRAAFTRRKMA